MGKHSRHRSSSHRSSPNSRSSSPKRHSSAKGSLSRSSKNSNSEVNKSKKYSTREDSRHAHGLSRKRHGGSHSHEYRSRKRDRREPHSKDERSHSRDSSLDSEPSRYSDKSQYYGKSYSPDRRKSISTGRTASTRDRSHISDHGSRDSNKKDPGQVLHSGNGEEGNSSVKDKPIENEVEILEIDAPLDDIILGVLGEAPLEKPEFGAPIHSEVAPRWDGILLTGLQKQQIEQLRSKYLIPSNCTSLASPKLNVEVEAGLIESIRKKDSSLSDLQAQLGKGLAALGTGLTHFLMTHGKNGTNSVGIVSPLADCGRILTDLHYKFSQTRKAILLSNLPGNLKKTVESVPMDNFLFGKDLALRLKAAKDIEKVGVELKGKQSSKSAKTTNKNSQSTSNTQDKGRKQSLNWKRPTRSTGYRTSGQKSTQYQKGSRYNQPRRQ